MPFEITMPQLSDTMTEGTVIKWLKKEGDKIKSGEVVGEIETDKANMDMECGEAGTLAQILVPEGGKVPVGAVIAIVATGKENPADVRKSGSAAPAAKAPAPKAAAAPQAAATTPAPPPSPVSTATIERAASGEIHETESVGHGAGSATIKSNGEVAASTDRATDGSRLRVSPLAKRIAAEKGIDLNSLKGSGPSGRIVQSDVLSYSPSASSAVAVAAIPARILSGQKEVVPLTKMRAAIAAQLLKSKQSIPHFYETIDIDVEDVSKLRERLNKSLESEKIRISIGDIIAKAVTGALVRHPNLNATFNGTELTRHGDVNLGLAVALPEGLIVPVLRGVNQMGLKEIRQRSAELVDKARAGKLKQDDRTGATFTVSNLGTYGIREFSAIVNPPEVGILAVAAVEKRAVVRNDQIVARSILTVTLSADHRVVDGASAAEFLRTLKQLLEEPGLMLV
jgi:pyruvate dehydrogenase E2 component (dihydrolipoamide acetyltransferase)